MIPFTHWFRPLEDGCSDCNTAGSDLSYSRTMKLKRKRGKAGGIVKIKDRMFSKRSMEKEQEHESAALIRQSLRVFMVFEINKTAEEVSNFQVSMEIWRLANLVRRGRWWVLTRIIGVTYEKKNAIAKAYSLENCNILPVLSGPTVKSKMCQALK